MSRAIHSTCYCGMSNDMISPSVNDTNSFVPVTAIRYPSAPGVAMGNWVMFETTMPRRGTSGAEPGLGVGPLPKTGCHTLLGP